jgi:hypothetical protein
MPSSNPIRFHEARMIVFVKEPFRVIVHPNNPDGEW